jgi:hypothetical protein
MTAVLCFAEFTPCPTFPLYWHNILLPLENKTCTAGQRCCKTPYSHTAHCLLFRHHVRFRQHFMYTNIYLNSGCCSELRCCAAVLFGTARCSLHSSVSTVFLCNWYTFIYWDTANKLCSLTGIHTWQATLTVLDILHLQYLRRYTYSTWHATRTVLDMLHLRYLARYTYS